MYTFSPITAFKKTIFAFIWYKGQTKIVAIDIMTQIEVYLATGANISS